MKLTLYRVYSLKTEKTTVWRGSFFCDIIRS
jgi:hypothetical protein